MKNIKTFDTFINESFRMMDGCQAWVFNFQINHLIKNLKKNHILIDYIEKGEQSRFYIPKDEYLILGDEISKELNKPKNDVTNALKEIGQLKKKVYSDISGLCNFKELMGKLFYELGLNVDEETAKKIYYKYKDNTDVEGLTSKLFEK